MEKGTLFVRIFNTIVNAYFFDDCEWAPMSKISIYSF